MYCPVHMRKELDKQPELGFSEYRDFIEILSEESSQDTKIPGARISPSKIELLSSFFNQYNKTEDKENFFKEILQVEPVDKDKVIEIAKKSINGTLLHNLLYFSNVFSKTDALGRLPKEKDFRAIFPNKKDVYYESLIKVLDLTVKKGVEEDPLENALNFWHTWRRNGQDFTPKKHKNYIIDPDIIRYFWENHTIPKEELRSFKEKYQQKIETRRNLEEKNSTFLVNESFLLLNIYFPNCNCQVPTFIDEIQINKNFPETPIKVIDYKTGKQFKNPGFKEKVQIFLMTISVFTTLIDRVNDIDYSSSQWDIIHSENCMSLPRFSKKSLLKKNSIIRSIYARDIPEMRDLIKKHIQFSYVNPVTQEELIIEPRKIFLENITETNQILGYINRLTEFYIEYKELLKHKLSNRRAPYVLPTFPREGFLDDKEPCMQDSVQLSLNV